MLKTIISAASLATIVASVGCSAPAETSAPSSDEALASSGTLSLAEAESQVSAIRATYEPNDNHALLFDPSLATAYVNEVTPVFARTAVTDKVTLGSDAFTYVSTEVQSAAIFDDGLFDDAVPSYEGLYEFATYWGDLASNPELWTKVNGLIARSTAGALSDLQILEIVTSANTAPADLFAGLQALGYSAAKDATLADARSLIADETVYQRLSAALLGDESATGSHDIDETNTFGVAVFKRTFSKLRLLTADDSGEILVDFGGYLGSVAQYTGHPATNGIALAQGVLTASEMKQLAGFLH